MIHLGETNSSGQSWNEPHWVWANGCWRRYWQSTTTPDEFPGSVRIAVYFHSNNADHLDCAGNKAKATAMVS